MFKKAVIHYPRSDDDLIFLGKELAAFRLAGVLKYIDTLKLSETQLEDLYAYVEEAVLVK